MAATTSTGDLHGAVLALLLASSALSACAFWDMGDWSRDAGTGGDAGRADAGATDAGSDASAGEGGGFCATSGGGAVFCADFDEDTDVGHGWSSTQADPGTTVERDTKVFVSPPGAASVRVTSGSCTYGYLGYDKVPAALHAATLAFDVRVGETDGTGFGTKSTPVTREHFCAGNCDACPSDQCVGTAVCYYLLQATADGMLVHEQVYPPDGGAELDITHDFSNGAHPSLGAWARVAIAVDTSAGTLTATMATDGGAPQNVLADHIDPACANAALRSMALGYTCAPNDTTARVVRFDNVVLE